jgi:hypothetical protein
LGLPSTIPPSPRDRNRKGLGTRNVLHGDNIDIEASKPARISIKDNAGGFREAEFLRAFPPADDLRGLPEFGRGMKSAACWFASHVR